MMNRETMDSIGDPIVLISEDRKILFANRMAHKVLGIDFESIGGEKKCCDVLDLDICFGKCPADTIRDDQDVVNNYLVKRSGQSDTYCVSTSVLRDGEGKKDGVVHTIKSMEMVNRLIEDQKISQEKLRRGRKKMQAIFDSIADGVFTVDHERKINHFSSSMEKITGFREEEVIGRSCSEVLKGNICETDCPISWSVKEKKEIEKCREVIVTKEGLPVPVFITTSLPYDGDKSMGVVCTVHDRSEIEHLRKELAQAPLFSEMVGTSKQMQGLFAHIEAVSVTDAAVLVQGETGTGKELVARAIHQRSSRNRGPFVVVNCSALSPFLLESELFGHVRGAFTGAIKDKRGKIEAADGGTLFLDEISEVSADVQVKLLRFLQFMEYERVGETGVRKVDLRIIAATNRDLKEMVRGGKFREDLYYRLNVIPVKVPSLRERKEDISLLVEHFIAKHRKMNSRVEGVSSRGLKNLIAYSWPGNVRELENAVMYAMSSCPGRRIERMCLPPDVREIAFIECPQAGGQRSEENDLDHIEKQRILKALIENSWKVAKAAESIGYSRITMWRRMKKFNVQLPNRS